MSSPPARRWAWAEVDLGAIGHNVGVLSEAVAPAAVWAVVKADAYGHGAVPVACAALAAGASGLCVALVQEGAELREAGIEAPVLVLSEQPPEQYDELVGLGLSPTVYTADAVRALAAAARRRGNGVPIDVHVKVDTGMRRVGAAPSDVLGVVDAVLAERDVVRFAGISTHLAVADEPDRGVTHDQLDVFDAVLRDVRERVRAAGLDPAVVRAHAANSAGALAHPRAHHDAVRTGIAVYGIAPGPALADRSWRGAAALRPAMRLVARVSYTKRVEAGASISYGHRHTFDRSTTVATVPIGYADGVPRRLSSVGGEVLVGGRRCPIVGVVTMDALMVDVGDDPVRVGDEVVLIGEQGAERIRAEEWADRLGTIGYEIVCGVSKRIERVLGRNIGA